MYQTMGYIRLYMQEGFAIHFFRREYGTFRLYSGNDGTTEKQVMKCDCF